MGWQRSLQISTFDGISMLPAESTSRRIKESPLLRMKVIVFSLQNLNGSLHHPQCIFRLHLLRL